MLVVSNGIIAPAEEGKPRKKYGAKNTFPANPRRFLASARVRVVVPKSAKHSNPLSQNENRIRKPPTLTAATAVFQIQ